MICELCGEEVDYNCLIDTDSESDEESFLNSKSVDIIREVDLDQLNCLCEMCIKRIYLYQKIEDKKVSQDIEQIRNQIEIFEHEISEAQPRPSLQPILDELAQLNELDRLEFSIEKEEAAAEIQNDQEELVEQPTVEGSTELLDYEYNYFSQNSTLHIFFPINRHEMCISGLKLANTPLLDEVNAAFMELATLLHFLNNYYELNYKFMVSLPTPYFYIPSELLLYNQRARHDGTAQYVALNYRKRNLIEKITNKNRINQYKLNAAIVTEMVGVVLRAIVVQLGDRRAMLETLVQIPAWALGICSTNEYEQGVIQFSQIGVEVTRRFSCLFEPEDYCCFILDGTEHTAVYRDFGDEDNENFAAFIGQLFGLLEIVYRNFE